MKTTRQNGKGELFFCGRKLKHTEQVGMRIWMLADYSLCPGDEDCELDAGGEKS